MATEQRARLVVPVSANDHIQGPEGAPVTLVEYGDFECPYCRAALPIVQGLQERLGAQLRVVFRHLPLTSVHPHADRAAEASEAAAAQGSFWEMHAHLFANQDALDDSHLIQYAAELGLDTARFRDELATHSHAERVQSDFQSGVASEARGTPTFYLDGYRYDGPVGMRELLAAIQRSHPEIDQQPGLPVEALRIPRLVPTDEDAITFRSPRDGR
jgi:protein-disulfide isomerase